MNNLDHIEIVNLLIQLSIMILAARLFGELARRFHQPMVVGEIIAGVILGPSILGMVSPEIYASLFPISGDNSIVLEGIISVSVVLLLLLLEWRSNWIWFGNKVKKPCIRACFHSLFR